MKNFLLALAFAFPCYMLTGQVLLGPEQALLKLPREIAATSPVTADLNNDSLKDIIVAGDRLRWFANLGPDNPFSNARIIYDGAIDEVSVVDLDDDDDFDLVGAIGNQIHWIENLNGLGQWSNPEFLFEVPEGIDQLEVVDINNDTSSDLVIFSRLSTFQARDIKVAFQEDDAFGALQTIVDSVHIVETNFLDANNDGQIDILGRRAGTTPANAFILVLSEDQGVYSPPVVLESETTPLRILTTNSFVDIDNDNDIDVLGTIDNDNRDIIWFENIDGEGNFSFDQAQILPSDGPNTPFLRFEDLDGDQFPDMIFFKREEGAVWKRNTSEQGLEFAERELLISVDDLIDPEPNVQWGLYYEDYNNDGFTDILFGKEKALFLAENNLNAGQFVSPVLVSDNFVPDPNVIFRSLDFDDLDNDGFAEWIFVDLTIVMWSRFEVDQFSYSDFVILESTGSPGKPAFIDLDGDNDLDVLAPSSSDIQWIENENENGSAIFTNIKKVLPFSSAVFDNTPVDLDADGDLDFIYLEHDIDEIGWVENLDGQGTFGAPMVIDSIFGDPLRLSAKDLDDDGFNDIIASSLNEEEVIWFRNNSGEGFLPPETLVTTPSGNFSIHSLIVEDFDQDDDLDILIISFDHGVLMYENVGGGDNFSNSPEVLFDVVTRQGLVTDLDQDNLLDIVVIEDVNPTNMYWIKNLGELAFAPPQIIPLSNGLYRVVHNTDLDQDGDEDLLTIYADQNQVQWLENEGNGTFNTPQLLSTETTLPRSVNSGDVDGDGDIDILLSFSSAKKFSWRENVNGNPAISGYSYFDVNQDGVRNTGELGLSFNRVSIEPSALATYTNPDGRYQFFAENGTYTLQPEAVNGWMITSPENGYEITIQDTIFSNLDFGYYPTAQTSELAISQASATTRCNVTVPFWLTVKNLGTTFFDGSLSLKLPENVSYLNAIPAPDSISIEGLHWQIENLFPLQDEAYTLSLEMPGVDDIGDTLRFIATTYEEQLDGMLEEIAVSEYSSVLRCAYDPNDKLVDPTGLEDPTLALPEENLFYTIRFQNTGTDTAFNVRIEDQLDSDLDWTTFRPVSSSHAFRTELNDAGIVTFFFDDIQLVDSVTNEPLSHGYVSYQVQPLEDVEVGTEIRNTAFIYFDFNPPIQTNTTVNTIIEGSVSTTTPQSAVNVIAAPNPFRDNTLLSIITENDNRWCDIEIYTGTGQVLERFKMKTNQSIEINASDWPATTLILKVRDSDTREFLGAYKLLHF